MCCFNLIADEFMIYLFGLFTYFTFFSTKKEDKHPGMRKVFLENNNKGMYNTTITLRTFSNNKLYSN